MRNSDHYVGTIKPRFGSPFEEQCAYFRHGPSLTVRTVEELSHLMLTDRNREWLYQHMYPDDRRLFQHIPQQSLVVPAYYLRFSHITKTASTSIENIALLKTPQSKGIN